jgi:hypothetical protein
MFRWEGEVEWVQISLDTVIMETSRIQERVCRRRRTSFLNMAKKKTIEV